MNNDNIMFDPELQEASTKDCRRFVVAVDFGTTCSSVCYVGLANEAQRTRIGEFQIETVERFPNTPFKTVRYSDVPTEISYQVKTPRQLEPQPIVIHEDDSASDSSSDDREEIRTITSVAGHKALAAAAPHPNTIRWGYEVHDQFQSGEFERENCIALSRFKLMLDDSNITKEVRDITAEKCRILKGKKLIKEDLDVIADYLDQLFRCTKSTLESSERWQESEPIEFVLCVPAVWTARACRQMQVAMTTAIKNSGLGHLQDDTVDNLFIVSEPEAAATCILDAGHARVKLGERFVLLDAGGGTVDAITYEVERVSPLRLKEIVQPGGALCGSSFINERFRKLLEKKLANEKYLEDDGESLTQKIESLVVEFERIHKRRIDEWDVTESPVYKVKIPGLKPKSKPYFEKGMLLLTPREVDKKLFRPSIEGVAKVMGYQIDEAQRCDESGSIHQVEKVILVGGFGQSVRLEKYLREQLKNRFTGRQIELIVCNQRWSAAAIARGGVLRALRKEDGPARILQSSFGFLRTERYGTAAEHSGQTPVEDKIDGHLYIDNTVDWVLSEGDIVEAEKVIERRVENTFGYKKGKLLCRETLVVSDRRHRSHYNFRHPENTGAEIIGDIEVDMTYLRATGAITPCQPPQPKMFPYWKVSFILRIIVSGRNLRYEVVREGENGIREARQVSIAAAFRPGTD